MSTPSSAIPNTPAESAQPRLSEPARLINVFASPSKTFQDIRQNASWWVPLVILSIASILFFQMIDKKVGFEEVARRTLENNQRVQQLPPDQLARTIEITAKGFKYGGFFSPIIALISAALIAGVLWFSFNFFMDAEIPFGRAIAIVFYGWLPTLVGTGLAIITLTLGNPEGFRMENPVGTNPAYFLDPATTSKFLYTTLTAFDIVTLWCVALIGIGFAINAKKKISPAMGIMLVAGWFFVYKFGSAAIAALRG
jgi:hypothetical protein